MSSSIRSSRGGQAAPECTNACGRRDRCQRSVDACPPRASAHIQPAPARRQVNNQTEDRPRWKRDFLRAFACVLRNPTLTRHAHRQGAVAVPVSRTHDRFKGLAVSLLPILLLLVLLLFQMGQADGQASTSTELDGEVHGSLAMAVVTWKVLSNRVASGRGQGHGDNYLPWIWIHRKNVSARGNQVVDPLPGYRRASHFLAQVEWHTALLCIHLGALDVREQFPLWPQPHLHPLADHIQARKQRWRRCQGLLAIAKTLGVEHGSEVGSDAPYIATIDIAATVRRSAGLGIAGIALKPHELILTSEPEDRINQRLQMEEACMTDYGATHKIVDRSILGHRTGGNLEMLSSGARLPKQLLNRPLQYEFRRRFIDTAIHTSINTGIDRTAEAMGLDPFSANLLWRNLTWRRSIPIDITLPLEMGLPLKLGGQDIAQAMATELFGKDLV